MKNQLEALFLAGLGVATLAIIIAVWSAPSALAIPCGFCGPQQTTGIYCGTGSTCAQATNHVQQLTLAAALDDCPADICNSSMDYLGKSTCRTTSCPAAYCRDARRNYGCCLGEGP